MLRRGDLFALMVKTCVSVEQYQAAAEAFLQMERQVTDVHLYLDEATLTKVPK